MNRYKIWEFVCIFGVIFNAVCLYDAFFKGEAGRGALFLMSGVICACFACDFHRMGKE